MGHAGCIRIRRRGRDAFARARRRHRARRRAHLVRRERCLIERVEVAVEVAVGLFHPFVLDLFLVHLVILVLLRQHADFDHGVNVDAGAGEAVNACRGHGIFLL